MQVSTSAYYEWPNLAAVPSEVKRKKRFALTTDSNHQEPIEGSVLNRDFAPVAANRAWTTDITCIWTLQRWVYPGGGDGFVFAPHCRLEHGWWPWKNLGLKPPYEGGANRVSPILVALL